VDSITGSESVPRAESHTRFTATKKKRSKHFSENKDLEIKETQEQRLWSTLHWGRCPYSRLATATPETPRTLTLIDIDCKNTGTPAGAMIRRAPQAKYFPGLYYEVSTNGNGIHAYPIIVKQDYSPHLINKSSETPRTSF